MKKKPVKVRELTLKINNRLFPMLAARGVHSIYALANSIDENAGSLSKIKRGISDWTIEQLEKIRVIHGISPDMMFGEKHKPEINISHKFSRVPVLGYAECGSPAATWQDNAARYFELADVSGLLNPFILVAKGDSMRPYINPGDKLLCSEHTEKMKNNTAIVAVFKSMPDTAEANAKLVSWDKKNKLITLYSINTKFPPTNHHENEFIKIYKVNRIIRDVK